MKRRDFLKGGLAGMSLASALSFSNLSVNGQSGSPLPEPSWNKLPRWKGFNLLEKFLRDSSNGPFHEEDFQNIRDLGFNFVRLPMDYRIWTENNDWRKINEKALKEIDQAIQWGEKYDIHVQLNFHRAPGWTVAQPAEEKSLWDNAEALDVCCLHWNTFARRYQGIPNENLSFNLFNEPANVEEVPYLKATTTVIDAVRTADAERLIICDGLNWGREPCLGLVPYRVAQATRGYDPMDISHYGAEWVDSKNFAYPTWPVYYAQGLIAGPEKTGISDILKAPIHLQGRFVPGTKLRIRVHTVSTAAELVVLADNREIFRHVFQPREGEGEWKKVVYREEWNTYQNIYDRDYLIDIPAETRKLEIRNESGDWIALSELGIQSPDLPAETKISLRSNWNQEKAGDPLVYSEENGRGVISGAETIDRDYLKRTLIHPWQEAEKLGTGVMVGEFGAYNKTPHDVVLRWFEDMLRNWQEAGWGFALWNFRGSIGIADSGRSDVKYESWRGLELDREMIDLLQKY